MLRLILSPLRQPALPRSSTDGPDVEEGTLVQEEQAPHTELKYFYPMRIGDVLKHRYQVTAKLGCGARSTVWLARDLHRWKWQPAEYVAIKVTVTGDEGGDIELSTLKHITKANKKHPGYASVRILQNYFHIRGPEGKHLCMVYEPLRESLGLMHFKFTNERVSVRLLKVVARQVLEGLDYLHSECHLIHCDLSVSNIIFSFAQASRNAILADHSQDERTDPLPVKRLPDRIIYEPHNNFGPIIPHIGAAIITDFDASTYGDDDSDRNHDIQPQGFAAPEVLLRAGFSYSADIWNFGVMLCGLVEGKPLFDNAERTHWKEFSEPLSFARMIAILGPPPDAMLDRASRLGDFYDAQGRFKYPELVPENLSLETFFTRVEGKDKEKMIAFAKKMLKWMPEERATAEDLLNDAWLRSG